MNIISETKELIEVFGKGAVRSVFEDKDKDLQSTVESMQDYVGTFDSAYDFGKYLFDNDPVLYMNNDEVDFESLAYNEFEENYLPVWSDDIQELRVFKGV